MAAAERFRPTVILQDLVIPGEPADPRCAHHCAVESGRSRGEGRCLCARRE
jgi:hypothetical protein